MDNVIQTLYQRRLELESELSRIDSALAALVPPTPVMSAPPVTQRLSVRQMLVALLDEADRDWSVSEVLEEYKRRGTPVHGTVPDKSLRSALVEAKKAGQVENTRWGRYRSTKFTPSASDAMSRMFGGGPHPEGAPG